LEYPLTLSGIGVYDEGSRPLRSEVSYPDHAVAIKAWVPGAVDTKKTVSVVYHVRRGVLAYEDHDELYWNATGGSDSSGGGRTPGRARPSTRRHRDGRRSRGARLPRDRADHHGVRRAGLHVQAAEAGRRRPRAEGLRALRAGQGLRRRLGDQHAPALGGAARLRQRVPADPRPALSPHGAGRSLPRVAGPRARRV